MKARLGEDMARGGGGECGVPRKFREQWDKITEGAWEQCKRWMDWI